jgi:glycosyltransferase involved in cell wall biosynthesis
VRHVPTVVQHSFGEAGSGGPIGALERLLASDLSSSYDFVRMHQADAPGGIDVPRIKTWVALLRKVKPDLVHVRGLGNEGFHGALAARLAGCPRVLVSIHGTVRDLTGPDTRRRRVVRTVLEPATLRLATHVTTVCEYAARRDFVRRHESKLVGPIINGVEMPTVAMRQERHTVRDELGLVPGDVALISVGRLSMEKGHGDLARSLELLPSTMLASIVMVVVGDGPDAAQIQKLYQATGVRTRLLGRRLDVSRLLVGADVFAFPSWHENLSNALLEAMAHRLPVVATRVGGNTEVLERGGGRLVEPHDPRALAAGLAELVASPELRAALGDEASAVVQRHYSLSRMTDVLDATYQEVLAAEPR